MRRGGRTVIRRHKLAALICTALLSWSSASQAKEISAPIPIYSENELINLIEQNTHLARVKADNCQLVEDIMARATRISLPAYEFLYGDMLAWESAFSRTLNSVYIIWRMQRIKAYPSL